MLLALYKPPSYQVTNTDNSGNGSLRKAIEDANNNAGADVITFTLPANSTIIVLSPFLVITDDVTIDGSTATNLTISGGGNSRIFWIQNGTITIQNLTLADGYAKGGDSNNAGGGMGAGGAIFMHEGREGGTGSIDLRLINVTLRNNQAIGGNTNIGSGAGGGGMGGYGGDGGGGGGVLGSGDNSGGSITDALMSTPGNNGGIPIFGNGGTIGVGSPGGSGAYGGGGGVGVGANGGSGAYGGGGGIGVGANGGNGGFGGGGGFSVGFTAGNGGFGGGGAFSTGGITKGTGGFGAGDAFVIDNPDPMPDLISSGAGMGAGGAIFVASGKLTLQNVIFDNNAATGGTTGLAVPNGKGKGYGGALFIFNKADNGNTAAPGTTNDPQVLGCNVTFTNNNAADDLNTDTNNDNFYGSFNVGPFTNGIIYVNASAGGVNNGTTWTDAFTKLQDALTAACTCGSGEIWVAKGTYYPDEAGGMDTDDRNSTFQLCNNVKLYGGFSGNGTETLLSERNIAANVTILSGDIDKNNTLDNGNSYHVVTGSGTDATAVLDGFTITAGNANGNFPNNNGGGMLNDNGSPTIANCTFSGNRTGNIGGGILNSNNSSPRLTNCIFSGNMASFDGGGMCNIEGSSPIVSNCTFSSNMASFDGGGMYNFGSSPTVSNGTFSGNTARFGGGMYNFINSSPSITNCIIWNNRDQSGTGTDNASIFNNSSTPTITYSLIQNITTDDANGNKDGTGVNGMNANYPQFVTPVDLSNLPNTTGDLRLQPSSPAINMGDNAVVTVPPFLADVMGDAVDLDGNKRIVASTVDMGAYESPCPTITAEIAGTTGICPSGSANLTVTITGGAAPYTLVYSPDGGTTEVTVNNYQSGANIAVMPGASTTYTLIAVTDANGCPATSLNGNATVTVNPLPTASVSAATSPICADENAVFNLIGTANAEVTYNINNGSNQTVNLDGNGEATVTVNNATADQTLNLVSVKNTSTNCVQNLNGNATVMVNQPATVEAGTAQTICQTKTVDLTSIGASIGGGASAGVWSTSGDGIFTGGTAFGSATAYVPGTNDKKLGAVVLTLSTTDAGVCPNVADQVVIKILKVDCGAFPWNGN